MAAELKLLTPEQYMAGMDKAERQAFIPTVSLVYNIGQFVQDLVMKKPIVDAIDIVKENIEGMLRSEIDVALTQVEGGATGNPSALIDDITRIYRGLYDNWQAGVWRGMGTAVMGAQESFLGSGQLIYAYRTLMYNTGIVPRMRRYWNRVLSPNQPDANTAWKLYKMGKMTYNQFKAVTTWDGWPDTMAANLDLLFKTWPDEGRAYRWWRHGLINDEKRDFYYGLAGWDSGVYDYITDELSEVPSPREAALWVNLGKITPEQRDKFYTINGWDSELHPALTEEFKARPDAWGSFRWWRKGLIDKDARNAYWKAGGWDSGLYDKLESDYYWSPSPYELARIADFVELDQTWAVKKLKAAGVSDADVAKLWPFIQQRPLREEVRSLTTEWIWRYRYGRATIDELSTALTEMGIKTGEKTLDVARAELQYEDELVNEWIEIYQWRFRTAQITEDEFYEDLLALGIRTEKANAIVELEKAKGYTGGYAY